MSIIRWEPRQELSQLHRNFERMFDDLTNSIFSNSNASNAMNYIPRVDISEDNENFYFIAELPGMKPEDVRVSVSDGILTIRGEKKRTEKQQTRRHFRVESSAGEFVRQFSLPGEITEDKIEANFDHGVLEIQIPKAEPVKPKEREIAINAKPQATLGQNNPSGNTHVDTEGKLTSKKNVAETAH
jgi:HSP20 family protein